MSKRHATGDTRSETDQKPAAKSWPLWAKALASGLLILHLAAVFVAPFSFACNAGSSSSPFADALAVSLRPYIVALYLDHGYFFFAPNPGPSRLVDFQVEFADGRTPVKGRFPNLATQWPRLLYHRHFMLSEAFSNRYVPPTAPPEPSPPPLTASAEERLSYQLAKAEYARALASWKIQRGQYEALRGSIAAHLKAAHGGDQVTLTRIEHRLALPDEMQAGGRALGAAESYVELPEAPRETSR